MLDSSSSDEGDDANDRFSGYGNKATGSGNQRMMPSRGRNQSGRGFRSESSSSFARQTSVTSQHSQSAVGGNYERYANKRANGNVGGAVYGVDPPQPSTPYRNVPAYGSSGESIRFDSPKNREREEYNERVSPQVTRGCYQSPNLASNRHVDRIRSQHSVPGHPSKEEEVSLSNLSLNAPSSHQQSAVSGYGTTTQGSSTYSVNSSDSGDTANGDNQVSNSPQMEQKLSTASPSRVSQPPEPGGSAPPPKDPAALELEQSEREEHERRQTLQLYVFVMRCVAYPFYSKPPTQLVKRYLKITKQHLNTFKERFQAYLSGEMDVVGDEAFTNAIQSYYEIFLRSDRVASMVRGGGCSMHDFREVFRLNSEHRVRCLPQIEGLNKANVVSAWMVKFDQICRGGAAPSQALQKLQVPQTEVTMTKEQLYELFQSTLGVKKYEHQILYNALQLDNADEQAAQVRRELDGQLQMAEELSRSRQLPRLVMKDMEPLYIEELKKMVGELMLRLEAVPVTKGSSSFQKFKKHNRNQSSSGAGSSGAVYSEEPPDMSLKSKLDIQLSFTLEVIVGQVRNLKHLPSNKMVYCTMEVEGGERLQTDLAEAGKPTWGTEGDFTTNQPLPTVKVKLYAENSGLLSFESGRELGRITLNPKCTGTRQPEWYRLQTSKGVPDDLDLQLTVRMDKPTNLKYCGYLFALGRTSFKKWKRRYICLIQVSQYTFIMASYKERKSDPLEIMQLEGFTVDYCDTQADLVSMGGKYFFNLVKEGDSLVFATEDLNERQLWVQAIYRATGQTHKPVPPSKDGGASLMVSNPTANLSASGSRMNARMQGDVDRARKHGLDEFVSVESWHINHAQLFRLLQSRALDYRMKDPYVSLGWFSPNQMFILDEYCARYGVRGCHRHLCYLSDLLDRAEHGVMIDPALIHYSYAFCCCHVFGNAQDSNIRTVLYEERQMFLDIRQRLYALLEKQITEFRYYFPFGRPEGALKLTLGLLERVLMKDTGAPASAEEVREVIRRCLEQAALVNYTRISEYAAIESGNDSGATQNQQHRIRTLADLIHLAELCIEVLRQNEEHHAEAFAWFHDLLTEHAELFWGFFSTDMTAVLETLPPDCWDSFPLFQLLNDYLISEESLKGGKFHQQLTQIFAPLVVRYVDLMEASIAQSIGGSEHPASAGGTGAGGGGTATASGGSGGEGGGFNSGFNLGNVAALGNVGSLVSAVSANAGGLMAAATAVTSAAGVTGASQNPVPVTSEELIWKLEALQTFIRELHWPDAAFAEHLDNRLKMMAADMIDAAAQRNLACFETWLKRSSKSTDFILPNECCVMVNTVADLKASILKLCTKDTKGEDMHEYHNQTETNLERIQRKMSIVLNEKMGSVLESQLTKLARYDVNTLLSSVLSLAKPTDEGGKAYVEFLRVNLEQMRQKVSDELYILSFMETWYMTQTRMINDWLVERKNNALSPYQFTCLSTIMKKMYSDFELQGISPDALDTMAYKTITQRLQLEETTHAVRPESNSSPTRSLLGSITGGLSGLSSGFSKPGFLSKI
ncbi:unnamed protein product [Calicophoron daubneyi]|uniref:Calcium-dependent secretion activator n=1 Tax=Calicophoron daubneyi TaxID=300641 RepID=A0AAV2TAW6_CALDB